jgi:hypothetical protein
VCKDEDVSVVIKECNVEGEVAGSCPISAMCSLPIKSKNKNELANVRNKKINEKISV